MSLLLQILGISNSHVSPCLLQSNGFPWPHLLYQALITCCRCYCKGRFSSLFLSQQNCCVWNEKKKSILPTRSTATNESLNSSQCHRAFRQHQVIQENNDWSCVLWQTRVPSQTFLIWCYGNLTSRQVKGGGDLRQGNIGCMSPLNRKCTSYYCFQINDHYSVFLWSSITVTIAFGNFI